MSGTERVGLVAVRSPACGVNTAFRWFSFQVRRKWRYLTRIHFYLFIFLAFYASLRLNYAIIHPYTSPGTTNFFLTLLST